MLGNRFMKPFRFLVISCSTSDTSRMIISSTKASNCNSLHERSRSDGSDGRLFERKFDGARSIQDATWLMILEGNPRSTSRIPLISPHLRLALRKYHKSSRWTVEPFIKTRCFGGFLCHRLWKLVGHSGLGFGESRRGFPLNSPLHSPVEDKPSWVFDARVLDEVWSTTYIYMYITHNIIYIYIIIYIFTHI